MFLFGNSRKSWKTQPIRRRSSGTRQLVSRARSLPATWILPSVGRSSRRINRRNVDLPEPDGPTRKTNSPFSTSRLTFSRAGRLWLAYVLVTLSKWITGPSHVLGEIGTHAATGAGAPALPAIPAGLCWYCPGLARRQSRGETGLRRATLVNSHRSPNSQEDGDERRTPDQSLMRSAGGRGTLPRVPG